MTAHNVKELKQKLLQWIEEQDFPNANTDDKFLLRFVEGTKYNLETAKSKMKCYYRLRQNCPEWFGNRDPLLPEIEALLCLGVFLPLLKKDKNDRVTILVRPTLHDPYTVSISNVYKVSFMMLDLALEMDSSIARNGVNVLLDLTGVSLRHVFQMTPFMIQKTVHAWQSCYPVLFKSMNFVNCPSFVGFTLKLMKNFMGKKLRKRVKIYGSNFDHLELDFDCLPEEYGGTYRTLPPLIESWGKKAKAERDWFLQLETAKGDIKLNPEVVFKF